jgi:hypothetical protein
LGYVFAVCSWSAVNIWRAPDRGKLQHCRWRAPPVGALTPAQIAEYAKPDWTKHAKAAPFKRNDAMLDVLPIGVMVFPGTGIWDNLADKAKRLGIPARRVGASGA